MTHIHDAHAALRALRHAFAGPEDINDSPKIASSKRIMTIFNKGSYSKTEHGPIIAEAIGLEQIRR